MPVVESHQVGRGAGGALHLDDLAAAVGLADVGGMEELKQTFGLRDEDLNLNLGPLGNLM